jgi:hypothetical protein
LHAFLVSHGSGLILRRLGGLRCRTGGSDEDRGSDHRSLDPAMDAIVPKDWKIEKLAEGFGWLKGDL